MAKLIIQYRKEDVNDNYTEGKTYYFLNNETQKVLLSIAPEETRTLNEIICAFGLKENSDLEIDIEDKYIMEYEEETGYRVDPKLYPYFRNIVKNEI